LKATSFRRKLIAAVLLGLAIAGAAIRYWADNPSTLRDVGTLLLVMWVPAIGNIIGFFKSKLPYTPPVLDFDPLQPFTAHLTVQFTPADPQPLLSGEDAADDAFTLVIGREGSRARPAGPLDSLLSAPPGQHEIALELLHPGRALPRFTPGTGFIVLRGSVAVGRGTVAASMEAPL
jgi:hypothetical protein